jgi:hypothetical protein
MEGSVRTVFAAGQRTENCHVAFCPPFPSSPRVACRQLEGPETRIKLAQVLPQGVRIELRLAEAPDEEATVLLEVVAQSDPQADALPAAHKGVSQQAEQGEQQEHRQVSEQRGPGLTRPSSHRDAGTREASKP